MHIRFPPNRGLNDRKLSIKLNKLKNNDILVVEKMNSTTKHGKKHMSIRKTSKLMQETYLRQRKIHKLKSAEQRKKKVVNKSNVLWGSTFSKIEEALYSVNVLMAFL